MQDQERHDVCDGRVSQTLRVWVQEAGELVEDAVDSGGRAGGGEAVGCASCPRGQMDEGGWGEALPEKLEVGHHITIVRGGMGCRKGVRWGFGDEQRSSVHDSRKLAFSRQRYSSILPSSQQHCKIEVLFSMTLKYC